MSLTKTEARDAVMGVIRTAWLASGTTSSLTLLYDNVVGDQPDESGTPGQAEAYGRVTVRNAVGPAVTIGASPIHEATGFVSVQVFTPFGDGHALGDQIAKVVLDALRNYAASSGGLWFFNYTDVEVGQRGPRFQRNVGATFRYREAV